MLTKEQTYTEAQLLTGNGDVITSQIRQQINNPDPGGEEEDIKDDDDVLEFDEYDEPENTEADEPALENEDEAGNEDLDDPSKD